MKKIIILLILLTSFLFAEINECQSDIYYGNGIMTTKKEARTSLNKVIHITIQKEINLEGQVTHYKLETVKKIYF